jgi:hypothetical protein
VAKVSAPMPTNPPPGPSSPPPHARRTHWLAAWWNGPWWWTLPFLGLVALFVLVLAVLHWSGGSEPFQYQPR